MKIHLPLFALTLLFPISSHATDAAAQARAHYAAVEREIPNAIVVKRELQGYSTEGGKLAAYFQKGVPLKMVAKHFGESGNANDEIYFWNGRLFFILRTAEDYEKPIGVAGSPGKITKSRQRFYFKNGKMWRRIDENGIAHGDGEETARQESEHLGFVRKMLAGARDKAKVIVAH